MHTKYAYRTLVASRTTCLYVPASSYVCTVCIIRARINTLVLFIFIYGTTINNIMHAVWIINMYVYVCTLELVEYY